MIALREVIVGNARMALVWLLVSFVIDGVDGPVARVLDVKSKVPVIDGYILDVVIDFVACVVVPAAFLYQFDLIPSGAFGMFVLGLLAFTSAIWFSRTDMMSTENWFRGFPAAWNLVAPVLYIFHARPVVGSIVTILLSLSMITNMPFPHPVRVKFLRSLTLGVTIVWVAAMVIGVIVLPKHLWVIRPILLAGSIYYIALAIVQAWRLQTGRASRVTATSH